MWLKVFAYAVLQGAATGVGAMITLWIIYWFTEYGL